MQSAREWGFPAEIVNKANQEERVRNQERTRIQKSTEGNPQPLIIGSPGLCLDGWLKSFLKLFLLIKIFWRVEKDI